MRNTMRVVPCKTFVNLSVLRYRGANCSNIYHIICIDKRYSSPVPTLPRLRIALGNLKAKQLKVISKYFCIPKTGNFFSIIQSQKSEFKKKNLQLQYYRI